eukprot:PhM_4_TR2078/c1_g2_i10/m.47603
MCYDRALDWVRQWNGNSVMDTQGVSVDMRDTYSDASGAFECVRAMSLLELTLPSAVRATRIHDNFLRGCDRLTYLDVSSLANVSEIGAGFFMGCVGSVAVDQRD